MCVFPCRKGFLYTYFIFLYKATDPVVNDDFLWTIMYLIKVSVNDLLLILICVSMNKFIKLFINFEQ